MNLSKLYNHPNYERDNSLENSSRSGSAVSSGGEGGLEIESIGGSSSSSSNSNNNFIDYNKSYNKVIKKLSISYE